MDTETMNVAIPKALKDFVQQQVNLHGYSSTSEYVRELIRADQRQKAKEAVEAEILKGLHSGDATPMTANDWQEIKAEVVRRHAKKKGAR
jgi:antitoxin ParD1/3/4